MEQEINMQIGVAATVLPQSLRLAPKLHIGRGTYRIRGLRLKGCRPNGKAS